MPSQRIWKWHLLISNYCSHKGFSIKSSMFFSYFPKKIYIFQINMMGIFKNRASQSHLQSIFSLDPLNYKCFESRKCPDHLYIIHYIRKCVFKKIFYHVYFLQIFSEYAWIYQHELLKKKKKTQNSNTVHRV